MSYFSEKLYELRKAKGFSQEELADKLNVARQTISKWENGTTNPDTNNLIELSKIFGISIDEFVGNDEFIPKDDSEECKELKNNNKKKKIIKRVIIIVLILILLIYLVMIGIRWGIMYLFQIELVKKEANDVKQYGYYVSEVGFENGMNNKWDFSETQRYEDKLIIEHYTTNFTMDKTEYKPEKIRVEFYDGEEYYDIDLINKTYIKKKNAHKDEIFYNVTTINLDAAIRNFFVDQEFRIFNLYGWRFVFDFSNSIKITKQENGDIAYDVRLKETIAGVNNFSLLKDSTGRCTNILVTTDNGSKSVMDYESTLYNWYSDDLDVDRVKLPDLKEFTLIEE